MAPRQRGLNKVCLDIVSLSRSLGAIFLTPLYPLGYDDAIGIHRAALKINLKRLLRALRKLRLMPMSECGKGHRVQPVIWRTWSVTGSAGPAGRATDCATRWSVPRRFTSPPLLFASDISLCRH